MKTPTPLRLRPSSIDRLLECPSSALPGGLAEGDAIVARKGSASHEICAIATAHCADGHWDDPLPDIDYAPILARHGLPSSFADELDMIVAMAIRLLREMRPWLEGRELLTEERLDGTWGVVRGESGELFELDAGGTADIVAITRGEGGAIIAITVIDWKTGWGEVEHPGQLRTYGSLAGWQYRPASEIEITIVEAWVRHGELRTEHISQAEIYEHARAVRNAARRIGSEYGPGEACGFCPHRFACEASLERDRAVMLTLGGEFRAIERSDIPDLYEMAKRAERLAAQARAIVDAELARGPIPMSDGKALAKVVQEQDRVEFDAAKNVIGALGLSTDEINSAVRVSKGKLLDAVAKREPKGKGAGAKRATLAKLHEAGAIEKRPVLRTKVVPWSEE